MPEIQLPTGCKGDSNTPKQKEIVKNAWIEMGDKPTLSPRPGVTSLGSSYGVVRGAGNFNNPNTNRKELYQVQSDRLYRIEKNANDTFIGTDIGFIDGGADCILVASFTDLLILVKGESTGVNGLAYFYNDTDGLTQITDVDLLPSVDVAFLLGRFLFIPADGGPFFWSNVNDPSNIDSSKFADAETLPDKNIGVSEWKDNALIFGAQTIERLTYNASLATFQRVQGATLDVGYIGGRAQYGEDIMFIGREPNGDAGIYVYPNRQRVSGKYYDEVLNSYSLAELSGVRAQSFSWEGTSFVVWTLPNHSILFYGDLGIISSGVTGTEEGTWRATFITENNGDLICGDSNDTAIGYLSDIGTDFGEKIEGELVTFVRGAPRSGFNFIRLIMGITTGQSSEDATISLAVSEDGVQYFDEDFIDISGVGQFDKEISWGCTHWQV